MGRQQGKSTLKGWAQDGEVTGVAKSLGALKVTVEANPLLPKGGLEKSECYEPLAARFPSSSVLMRGSAGPEGYTHPAPGPTPCSLRLRVGTRCAHLQRGLQVIPDIPHMSLIGLPVLAH